nr:transposase [Priestia aryabhattai]MDH3115433.1 transposase [Priestia aryabhattai]MDH3125647.1 transposase [Priestia aryabhattai]MDH3125673.1 transposase [Priestia aryabhattai]
MRRKTYSAQEKYEIIVAYEKRSVSSREFCSKYDLYRATINRWIYLYRTYGLEGLQTSSEWKRYSIEIKTAATLDYLSGKYSQSEIIRKYEISHRSVLMKWIKNYNGHRAFKNVGKGMRKSMAKGRSTTLEERVVIAKHCLENGKNYLQTAEDFNVSYQQVYQWVKKFEIGGKGGLFDKRGKKEENRNLHQKKNIKKK